MDDRHTILAFDTSLNRCSAGVFNKNTKRIVSKYEDMERGHSEALIPLIQAVLEEAGLTFGDLDAIATPLGPGAFTGLRIGLSAAKSLGLSLDIPVIGFGTFDLLARQYFSGQALPPEYEALGILIETRRADFYVRLYEADGSPLTDPTALEGAEITARHGGRKTLWIGDGAPRFKQLPSIPEHLRFETLFYVDPATLITAAQEKLPVLKSGYTGENLDPIYLRGADVSISKTIQRGIV